MSSLQSKTISNIFWSFSEKFASRGIGFITTIILARLLTPKDFGLIAMLTIFISVSESLSNGGFNHALIQKKDVDEDEYSAVFFINLGASAILYIILFITAPGIANFYDQPMLIPLTRILSLSFVINAFCYIQQTKLTKELQFKTLMIVHIPATIVSAIVAISMAYKGFGVWSLVAQTLSLRLVLAIQLWFQSKWRPINKLNIKKAKPLFSFGGKIMVSRVIDRIYNNIYLIVIGRFYSAITLGYYQNSFKLVNTPTDTFSSVIRNVTFPAFSSVQEKTDKLKLGLKKSNQHFIFILLPILVICAVIAEPLFRFLLTAKWLPSVPYFQILCIAGIITPLSQFSLDMMKVKGRGGLFLKLNVISKSFILIGLIFLLVYKFNIWWLLGWQVITSFMQYFLNGYFCGILIDYKISEQLKDILPNIILALLTGILVYLLDHLLFSHFPDLYRILLGATIGGSFYLFLAFIFKNDTLKDIRLILTSRKNNISL